MHLRRALRYFKLACKALDPRKHPSGIEAHQHSHPSYSEAELLRRAEEFNDNAERHWQTIAGEPAGRAHVLNKPFSTVRDTPGILYKLGLVLNELDLGVGMSVLDFGAGSCWLSSAINRLRCRTVAIDVSPTALRLGEELFRSDSRHQLGLEPQFLPYDGHTIPLPDACVDRAICFDSFHHVPNQDEVLAELQRVLKPGGRLVLAEPGEGHAHMDQSLFETEAHGVLENDLHMDELVARARKAGFDRFTVKPYPDAATFTFPLETYLEFMGGDDGVYPLQLLRENLRHFFIMVLGKGEGRADSRNPRALLARITPLEIDGAGLRGVAAKPLRFRVRLENLGDTLWLHEENDAGGYVMLGGHLLSEARAPLGRGFLRAALPRDVAPGEIVELEAELPVPAQLGRYLVQLDMVDEFVAWFEQCGSATVELPLDVAGYPDSRDPHRLAAGIELLSGAPATALAPGAPLPLRLRLRNQGDSVWLAGAPSERGVVSLGAHLVDASGRTLAQDYARLPLPRAVAPGEHVELAAELAAPPEAGRHRLRLDLVAEGVCWFEHMGSPPFELAVETSAVTPDSRQPGLLRAAIELPPERRVARATPGGPLRLSLRVTNTGNTLWRAGSKARGVVALGGHLYADDTLVDLDFLRWPLPRDVAPGNSVELAVEARAPETPGRYRLELDLVDEGIAWFASRGSGTATLELSVG